LSLCHRMVTDLGGAIAVESEVGKGAPLAERASELSRITTMSSS